MVTSRPWRDEADYGRLRRFLQALPTMADEGGNCTIGDLDWWRYTHNNPDKMRDVQLWLDEDGETVIGFVWQEESTFDCFIDPRHRDRLAGLVSWAESRAAASAVAEIELIANDRDEPLRALLEQRGYRPSETHYVYRGRSLTGELEPPALPEGFHFRDMRRTEADLREALTERQREVRRHVAAGETNEQIAASLGVSRHAVAMHGETAAGKLEAHKKEMLERRVNVHRAAWEPSKMTAAKHRAVMASPTYRPDLDLVVVAPDGEFATCTIVWFDPVNRIGVFEPVGCDPAYRQRGLTRALMLEGMARLKALGARNAFVNSLHDSLPANRLYEASGFRLVDRQRKWVKPLA